MYYFTRKFDIQNNTKKLIILIKTFQINGC